MATQHISVMLPPCTRCYDTLSQSPRGRGRGHGVNAGAENSARPFAHNPVRCFPLGLLREIVDATEQLAEQLAGWLNEFLGRSLKYLRSLGTRASHSLRVEGKCPSRLIAWGLAPRVGPARRLFLDRSTWSTFRAHEQRVGGPWRAGRRRLRQSVAPSTSASRSPSTVQNHLSSGQVSKRAGDRCLP